MYIMVKTYQNLELFGPDLDQELSILESRKHNQAVVDSNSVGLQSRSTPQRMACAVKQAVVKRGSRKSSSLTNGMSPGRNKTALREYGTEARGLDLSPFYNHLSMRPSWASADALSTAPRRRH
jgi:hypothetical protein